MIIVPELEERGKQNFLKNLVKLGEDDCWLYSKYNKKSGYGIVGVNRKISKGRYWPYLKYAHRISYEIFIGPIPIGMLVCHTCDTPRCVNPKHLFLGTDTINQADKVRKGRQPKGEDHYGSKLTEIVVKQIKSGILKPSRKLARELGVGEAHLYAIRLNKVWKHIVPGEL